MTLVHSKSRVHTNTDIPGLHILPSYQPVKHTETWLTQLDITDPDALLGLLQDFLKVNTCEATGDAGHQHGHHSHKLRVCSQDLLLTIITNHCRPLWGLEHRHTE